MGQQPRRLPPPQVRHPQRKHRSRPIPYQRLNPCRGAETCCLPQPVRHRKQRHRPHLRRPPPCLQPSRSRRCPPATRPHLHRLLHRRLRRPIRPHHRSQPPPRPPHPTRTPHPPAPAHPAPPPRLRLRACLRRVVPIIQTLRLLRPRRVRNPCRQFTRTAPHRPAAAPCRQPTP